MTTPLNTASSILQRNAVSVRRAVGILALVGLFALPQAASAQSRAPRADGDQTEQRVSQLNDALQLNRQQTTRLRAIFEAQESSRPAAGTRRSGSPDSRASMQNERQSQQAAMDRRIEGVLSPAQVMRFRALRASNENDSPRNQLIGQRQARR